MAVMVRSAVENDAEAATSVIRRSITKLCIDDHKNDPEVLRGWLANKTPEMFLRWLSEPQNALMVAETSERRLTAVGAYTRDGEITLNYVDPDFRFSGVSTRLLQAMEAALSQAGIKEVKLSSSTTAHTFYLSRGYEDNGPPSPWRGASLAWPMLKTLK